MQARQTLSVGLNQADFGTFAPSIVPAGLVGVASITY